MVCPKCKSPDTQVQAVNVVKRRGCLNTLFYIILLFLPVIGWIALFMLLRGRKSRTETYMVCQVCGFKKKL